MHVNDNYAVEGIVGFLYNLMFRSRSLGYWLQPEAGAECVCLMSICIPSSLNCLMHVVPFPGFCATFV